MKRLILLPSLMLFMSISFKASAIAILGQFQIQSQYVTGGKLLSLGGSGVTFSADVTFTKAGTTNNTVIASMVYTESGQDLVLASQTLYDGNWPNTQIWQPVFTGTLPANKTAGIIRMKYQLFEGSNSAGIFYGGTEYHISTVVIPPANPRERPTVPKTIENMKYLVPSKSKSYPNNTILATNGKYRLVFQQDANLVLYNNSTPIWNSRKTSNAPSTLHVVWLTGNLVIKENHVTHDELWNGGLHQEVNDLSIWILQDDGNFVLYPQYSVDANGHVTVSGSPIAATMTQGGKKSKRQGKIR